MDFDCTPAEEALLSTLEDILDELEGNKVPDLLKDRKVLVAGNRSGLLPCALAKAGAEVTVHAFDRHHARNLESRISEAGLGSRANVCCTSRIPEGPYMRAYFMVTPLSMSGELVLDQLEDIRANLSGGGELFAAFEGDAQESLKAMKKVFARVHVLQTRPQSRRSRRRGEISLFRVVKGAKDASAKRRNFAADWTASVPGGELRTFTSLPGCFCHRRADVGGLALAETACSLFSPQEDVEGHSILKPIGGCRILDMGCGCGFVGLLVADHLRAQGVKVDLTLLDSHARALEAARINALRMGFGDARLVLSDDGLPQDENGKYDLFLGNPPYYGDWKIAETFLRTAENVLKPGGTCLTVAKNEGGLDQIQSRMLGNTRIFRRRGYCVFSTIRS